ncbi:translation initiation factor IF-2 [Parabacteroides sp. PF5-5]|uniref:translation initiation factor IF-2 n=1 Tax=unclassified Parabacteroides TaxID=2649774 RepID=UPI0024772C0B|nr:MULTISPECIES: translation initiation factor IF-2 [unclassified Parabacteroides]MDH6303551.1 translation initiation factor IF-2 [Parabacteroides sp. PH5-39]MDH6314873.1 translation initiation factor IF-2 [Parabacteroides sp. PF5-13]MDH6318210.1 translation initiation factor IF-2 [Parabacteroides sp. PH5-13]MDH6321857.1 translation initiation factor IF-2 [Parabacteroides sp. PH5-8]MDH6325981.1 translation initiation factor IF-2 [Parabacteroides sp. PH5-41]
MPIKLKEVMSNLNVGLSTVVEFLHKNGYAVESNPNTRVNDEQFALLVKEFGKDLSEQERERILSKPQVPTTKETIVPEKKEKQKQKPAEIKTEIPEEYKPKLVTKGKIELEPKKKEKPPVPPVQEKQPAAVETEPIINSPIPTEAKEKPAVPKEEKLIEKESIVEEEKKIHPQAVIEDAGVMEMEKDFNKPESIDSPNEKEEDVKSGDKTPFRLNTPKIESNIKVTGKIDLSAINQSTRPKKKTKEERKKEREEKREKFNANKPATPGAHPFKGPKDGAAKTATPGKESADSDKDAKKKRKRIKKDRVDINNTLGTNFSRAQRDDRKSRLRKPVKAEVSEEDVQKQIKETLARLTNKGNKSNKGAKYRRDKRDAALQREHELMELEEQESKVLKLTEFVTANDLANMMNIPVTQVIATCMSIGIMVSINQRLDAETINIVAEEFGFKTEYVSAEVVEAIKTDEDDNEEDWTTRPPIVTVMGHVDHGKTSLLDNIRSANVIAGEAGGITQHIGAYNVKLSSGRRITFLDTPGHEAFTAMRARGAKVTDIAIIIVAADDNVMPQTIEAINHASAAGVPIVFAINKIDKPSANPEKIKEELANMNYLVEDWGGKYQSQEISAKKGVGVEELLEKVLLEADMLDLKANPTLRATGSIIESSLDKGRGYISTVLIENGTLKTGDVILAGTHFGRIKAMFNERNQRKETAGPSEPVLILGLNGAPQAGDTFNVLETDQEAREIAGRREQLQRELGLRTQKMLTLDDIGRRIAVGNFQELNVIVKGDVDGSVEALSDSLIRLSTEQIQVNVIHKAVGQISESDIVLAAASSAIIIGFQVRPSVAARRQADKDGVEIRLYSIIYDAIEDVKSAMEGMLAPEMKEEITAMVEVREVFKITKVGTVAGCMVKEGKIKRSNKIRLIRDGIVIYSGDLGSLKRFKEDVKEVAFGYECGLNITGYNDIKVGDIIESYEEIEVKQKL